MVAGSSIYPYQYHTSSWEGSETGKFRIPESQEGLVSPSAVHFEETMYVAKAEWNRVVSKVSGFSDKKAGAIDWFQKTQGQFTTHMNDGTSGLFDPNPSGAFLDGTLPLDYISNIGSMIGSVNIPAQVQDEVYIAQLRDIIDDLFDDYSKNGPWQYFLSFDGVSGVKKDWLTLYKGYTDSNAILGRWFLEDEEFSRNVEIDRMPSGVIFDRHLDELRLQPIPHLSIGNGAQSVKYFDNDTDFDKKGWQFKQVGWDRRPVRPIYLMTDGGLPSGWSSGTQLNYDLSPGATQFVPSGRGSHMISGIQLAVSGNGVWTALTGDYFSDLDNEDRPDSPAACRFENLAPSGKSVIPSGQHRLMMSNPGAPTSFPWGVSGSQPHFGAVWPWTGQYEPENGRLLSVNNRFWDITLENQSFWITDHAFCYRNNNGKTLGARPHVNSGIYWYQMHSIAHHTDIIDAWNMDSPRNSGMELLYGNAKGLGQGSRDGGSNSYTIVFGGGWAYDRSSNDYMIVGRSGLSGASTTRASGIYGRWNQQMSFTDGGVFGPITAGGVRWHIADAWNNADDGTNWIINGAIVSGLNDTPSRQDGWMRIDSSFNLVDAILNASLGWVNYLRGSSEYLMLDNSTPTKATTLPGKSGGKYKTVTPTWGNLTTPTSTGSVSTTEYTITYGTGMEDIINIATATAISRIHLCKFFETEPDNTAHCTFMAFTAGKTSGTTSVPDYWIGELDTSSHPFELVNAWMVQSKGNGYSSSFGTSHGDIASCDHMEIHVNG